MNDEHNNPEIEFQAEPELGEGGIPVEAEGADNLNDDPLTHGALHAASPDDSALEFAIAAARIADDNKAEDIVVLDLRGISAVADIFVIGTGSSDRQMAAVTEYLKDYAKTIDRSPYRTTGLSEGKWILADYVDVVLHMFDEENRAYYDLESLWGDAKRIPWEQDGNHSP